MAPLRGPGAALVALLLAAAGPVHSGRSESSASAAPPPIAPSVENARQNAFFIFNSLHSAMRQWGSSLNHNGLALIPATVPRGSLLYHGTHWTRPPPGPEWLAFEIEHSENFAWSWRPSNSTAPPPPGPPPQRPPRPPPGKGEDDDHHHQREDAPSPHAAPAPGRGAGQIPLGRSSTAADLRDDDKKRRRRRPEPKDPFRGYLHTYQATRDLNLLYVDGMAAAKGDMGTLDTQDLVLRSPRPGDEPPDGAMHEWERATEVCDAITAWGYDGLIRMEIGFEIIYCNFSSGLELVSAPRRPFPDQPEGGGEERAMFEFVRAVSQRYDGIGGGRVRLDMSRMVSGFFYPVNVTNPDPKAPELPRLAGATREERRAMRYRARDVASERPAEPIDWQGVADMIVSRYSDRLALMASDGIGPQQFAREIFTITNTHYDSPPTPDDTTLVAKQRADDGDGGDDGDDDDWNRRQAEAVQRCSHHFLQPVEVRRDAWTPEDLLIHAAVLRVSGRICDAAFFVRRALLDAVPALEYDLSVLNGLPVAMDEGIASERSGSDDPGDDTNERFRDAIRLGRDVVRELTGELRWTTWKKCRGCAVDQVCFVAMWPFGRAVDHYSPGCMTSEDFDPSTFFSDSYWRIKLRL